MKVLYISYDGMLEPLGQSQVLAYQEKLAGNVSVSLISFEKTDVLAEGTSFLIVQRRMLDIGIRWLPLRYHRRPSIIATSYDIVVGTICGLRIVLQHRIQIVHARSYVPAVMALALKLLTGVKFVFDMRGFWADERVDGGLWRRGDKIYRIAKWFERQFLQHADHIVSLTYTGVTELKDLKPPASQLPPCTVIPTCADLNRFMPVPSLRNPKIIGYVGTVGTWYLFKPVAYCLAKVAKQGDSFRFLIINQGEHKLIIDCLQQAQVPMDRVTLKAASFEEMPHYVAQMAASIFFIKPVFSKKASAPTKLAELLGCGVPCLTNTGVGDMAGQLAEQRCGITVSSFDTDVLDEGIRALLELMDEPDIALRCRQTAERHFSLEVGVRRYAEVYESLGSTPKGT